jgi:hypothetical protein
VDAGTQLFILKRLRKLWKNGLYGRAGREEEAPSSGVHSNAVQERGGGPSGDAFAAIAPLWWEVERYFVE